MDLDETGAWDAASFGPFRLVPAERQLERDGVPVRIGGRALDALIVLIEHAGETVTKRELMARVWPDVMVEDGSLRFCMTALRKALGDGQAGSRYVVNVPGHGYSFVAPVIRSKAGTARLAELPRNNLPGRLIPMIGREEDSRAIAAELMVHRFVTIVGAGGVGKTRLAIELGWDLLARFPDGAWLIDLAPLAHPAAVISATAKVLGVMLRDADGAIDAIVAAIGKRQLLLIFDNCEHLLGAAAALIDVLIDRVPALSVLATSQEVLHSRSEQVYHLNPLALPPSGATEIASYGAVMLFVTRARALDRRFALGGGNAAGVTEICRRLDGIPLALEMAAARLVLLGIEGLRQGLDERLRMLKLGVPLVEARHQTLRNLVEWSHGLLEAGDQHVFRRLAVFAGSFSLDAAIAVAGESPADRWDILDALGRLIDKSMLTVDGGEAPRYRLLETLRLFAWERLSASGEAAAIEERHAQYFANLFDITQEAWEATDETAWLQHASPELDNIRAALDWALLEPPHARIAAALACGTVILWNNLGLRADARRYADRAIDLIDQDTPLGTAALLLKRASHIWGNIDRPQALVLAERSVALYQQLGDDFGRASVLGSVGGFLSLTGRVDEAKAALVEAYEILSKDQYSEHRYKKSLNHVIDHLGVLSVIMDELAEARQWFTTSLDFARGQNDPSRMGAALLNLAEVEAALGALDRAIEYGDEAVTYIRKTKNQDKLGMALSNLMAYLVVQDRPSEARPIAAEALSVLRERGASTLILRNCLEKCALLGALEGRYEAASRLIGFVDRSFADTGQTRETTELKTYGLLLQKLEAGLPADKREKCAAEGARWSQARAVDFALDQLVSSE